MIQYSTSDKMADFDDSFSQVLLFKLGPTETTCCKITKNSKHKLDTEMRQICIGCFAAYYAMKTAKDG